MWDFNTERITDLLDWQLSMVDPASMWNDGDFLSSNDYSGDHDTELDDMMKLFEEICVTRNIPVLRDAVQNEQSEKCPDGLANCQAPGHDQHRARVTWHRERCLFRT